MKNMRKFLTFMLALLLGACVHPSNQGGTANPTSSATTTSSANTMPSSATAGPVAAAPPPAPIAIEPFEMAILTAANTLLSKAQLPNGTPPHALVIDPLIDGMTGEQSKASRAMGERISQLIRERYPQLQVLPFKRESVSQSPLVLIGTLTPINLNGKTEGTREAYRICLALADLKSGKLVGKGVARSQLAGVDTTPTPYFRDSPAWAKEKATDGYIKTCQGSKAGDAIDPAYLDRILLGTAISGAIDAYNSGQFSDALNRYNEARQLPGGATELRVLNGLYLTNYKLKKLSVATDLFGQIVDYGLQNQRLAMKLLFKAGTTSFLDDAVINAPYEMWLQQIAKHSAAANACLEISGHTSPSGPAAINDRLSQLRAETIRQRLINIAPALTQRVLAVGVGSKENLVGTGRDDASDALDRRAVFKVIAC